MVTVTSLLGSSDQSAGSTEARHLCEGVETGGFKFSLLSSGLLLQDIGLVLVWTITLCGACLVPVNVLMYHYQIQGTGLPPELYF